MQRLFLLALLFAGPGIANESLEGYLIYEPAAPMCPVSEASFPNLKSVEPGALDDEMRVVIEFYQFVVTNFSGYCLVELRLDDDNKQDVFISQADYVYLGDLHSRDELQKSRKSHFVRMQTTEVTDGNNTALKGSNLSYELVERAPEIAY